MKRIVIGRGNDCDIIIPDEHDNVSRHHAVISIDFFGRMTLSDTSSNGTFINGIRMLKGASIPVSREDEIQLGGAWIFDWSLVDDPYRKLRYVCITISAFVILLAIGLATWSVFRPKTKTDVLQFAKPEAPDSSADAAWNSDSTKNVAPTEMSITTPGAKGKTLNNSSKRKKTGRKTIYNKRKSLDKVPQTDNPQKKVKDYSDEKGMPAVN